MTDPLTIEREPQFTELVMRYLEGALAPEQADQLRAALADHADRRQTFVLMCYESRLLAEATAGDVESSKFKVQSSPAPTLRTPMAVGGRSVWYSAIRNPKSAIGIAALIALALTAWFIFSPNPQPPAPSPSVATPSVAMLSDLSPDAVFAAPGTDSAPLMQLGSDLPPGPIKLAAGRAQIMFKSTAVVDLTGPCEFEMTGDNRGVLHRGRIEAFVPPQAAHFTIQTPSGLRVTDLGTRFNLQVDADGERVVVSEGRVLAELSDQRLMLIAPQAAQTVGGRLVGVNLRTVLIDLGRSSQTTGIVNGRHWNNFAPNDASPGTVEPKALTPDLPDLRFADGASSGIAFDFAAADASNQGIGLADWPADFSQRFGYPVSATRDNFFLAGRKAAFVFSNLRTDGTRYDLTVFGALDPAVKIRPATVVRVGDRAATYSPNDPGQVLFTGIRPDASGRIALAIQPAEGAGCHLNVITLTEVSDAPLTPTLRTPTKSAIQASGTPPPSPSTKETDP